MSTNNDNAAAAVSGPQKTVPAAGTQEAAAAESPRGSQTARLVIVGVIIGGLAIAGSELRSAAGPQSAVAKASPVTSEEKAKSKSSAPKRAANNGQTGNAGGPGPKSVSARSGSRSTDGGAAGDSSRSSAPGGRTSAAVNGKRGRAPRAEDANNNKKLDAAPLANESKPTEPSGSAINLGTLRVQIQRILVGADVVRAGVLSEAAITEHAKANRYVVYLALSVANTAGSESQRISHADLRLEDRSGLMYEPLRTTDRLEANIEAGGSAKGGVAYAIYNDSAPARLLIRTAPETFSPLPEDIFQRTGD